ncbi:MAG: hypothetical protein JWM89_1652 [Acidimicrobiales bacterium]|nr:hypothetical protein [Acidimicrobiales bacterium]
MIITITGSSLRRAFVTVTLVAAIGIVAAVLASRPAPSEAKVPPRSAPRSAPVAAGVVPTGARDDGQDRVLFVGDSLLFGAHDELTATFDSHDVMTRFVGYPGTGLLTAQDLWLRGITTVVRTWHPDVVVIEACCNYANNEPGYRLADGRVVAADTEEMFRVWADHAADAVRRARAGGATVLWVTTPVPGPEVEPNIRARIVRFRRIADGLGVPQVDWRTPLLHDGGYTRTAVIRGVTVPIRKDDDLHLTDIGDLLVTSATWDTVAPLLPRPAR